MSPTIVARSRFGAYSEVIAMTLGSAPPRPMPVRRRQMMRPAMDWAKGVSSEKPRLAAEAVAGDTEAHGAEQPAEEADAEDRSEGRRRDVPGGGDLGRGEGDRLGVEPVHHRHQGAEHDDGGLKAAQASRVDDRFKIAFHDGVHGLLPIVVLVVSWC
jgi:hypothetical protein